MKVRLTTTAGSVELDNVMQINIDESLPQPVQIEVKPTRKRKPKSEPTPALPMGNLETTH